MGTSLPSPATSPPGRRAVSGFLVGACVFALFSFAAPLIEKAVSPALCALPPGGHFPSGACVFVTALLGALWIGPAAVLALFPAIPPAFHTMLEMRLLSGLMVALFAALLFAQAGVRKGAILFCLSSVALIGILTVLFSMFAVMF